MPDVSAVTEKASAKSFEVEAMESCLKQGLKGRMGMAVNREGISAVGMVCWYIKEFL